MSTTTLKNFYTELKKIGRGIKKLRFFKFVDVPKVFRAMSKKEKVLLLSLLAIFLIDVVASGTRFYLKNTTVTPSFGGTYSEGLAGEPRYINPVIAQTQTDKDISKLVYSGLYKYDGEGKLVPDLAESDIQFGDGTKVYVVKMKPNLKWHDGQAVTADDVVFTVQLLQNQDYKSPLRKLWQNIQIEKVDDLTVKFTNSDVSSPFVSNLTLGILPKHIWSGIAVNNFYLAKQNLEPVGSGPYFVKEINKTVNGSVRSVSLESYSNYQAGKPYIEKINLKFYQNNDEMLSAFHTKEIDAIGFTPFSQKVFADLNKSSIHITQLPLYQYQAVFFNQNNNPKVLGDKSVRTALAQGFDRSSFIKDVYDGLALPANTPILPGQIGYNPDAQDVNEFNAAQAEQTLDAAGWAKDPQTGLRSKGGQPLKFTVTTNDFVLNVKSAEVLQSQWKKIGADVNVNVVPTTDLENALRSRNYETMLFAESTGYDPDPFVFWHSSQSQNPGFNLSQYKSTIGDQLITAARSTFDPNSRYQKYFDFQNLFLQDLPAIILDQSAYVYEMRQDLKGMDIKYIASAQDRFYDVNHWYLTTKRSWKGK